VRDDEGGGEHEDDAHQRDQHAEANAEGRRDMAERPREGDAADIAVLPCSADANRRQRTGAVLAFLNRPVMTQTSDLELPPTKAI
jgi:hypothetical protein